jgi:peptidoglycan/xylan/chitin deacetylase (PgdA/CDA1 family)
MSLSVSFGFDCDIPRGIEFVKTERGQEMLKETVMALEFIAEECTTLEIPRTYFICGEFLESLLYSVGSMRIKELFMPQSELTEIGNHTWSHDVVSQIPTRPDKIPMDQDLILPEITKTNDYLSQVLGVNKVNGLRTPLGHPYGLKDSPKVLDVIKDGGFKYISSDIRCSRGGIEPPLVDEKESPRQPYIYPNGLIEVPSQGWHDTAFGGKSKTPYFAQPPTTYKEIIGYYNNLIEKAGQLSMKFGNYFLTLVMHPIEVQGYAERDFFAKIKKSVEYMDGHFITYGEVYIRNCNLSDSIN